jgi:hypothetical protein
MPAPFRISSRLAYGCTRKTVTARHAAEIRKLHRAGVSKSEIAHRLQIGRTSAPHFGLTYLREK